MRLEAVSRIGEGAAANVSILVCDVHAGTHVDAPWHFLPEGNTVEGLSLDVLVGPAVVVDCGEASTLGPPELEALGLAVGTERLLLRTSNSDRWAVSERGFGEDYVALSEDGAEWLVRAGVRLVGIDALSIQRFGEPPGTHTTLLAAGVVVLEGLDLAGVEPGPYELLCLPLRLVGADGAPARAILRRMGC